MEKNDALYWSPRGGNNYKDFWGSCHAFVSKQTNKDTGVVETDTVLVDLGQHEQTRDYENGRFDKVVPALDDIIEVPGFPEPDPEKKCKALFISHGHSDHIGAISTYVKMGAKLPPIYCSKMSANLIIKDFIENGIDEAKWPEINEINAGDTINIGNLKVRTMAASHSIPGAFSFKISNDTASIFHTGDTKGDPSSFLGNGVNFDDYKAIAEQGPIDLMTFDGTTAANNGHATYESEVKSAYSTLIKRHSDKQLIMPMASAHAERLATIISAAAENGKNVIINGGPVMDSTIVGLQMSGYDLQKLNPNIKIVGANSEEAKKMDPKKTVTITTGIYGESNAPMTKFCNGDKSAINIEKDAVIITPLIGSRSERLAQLLANCPETKDLITYTSKDLSTLYGSGHAQRDDFIKIAGILKPKKVTSCHASTKLANKFNMMASELGYSILGRQVKNSELVKVTSQGCEIIPNDKKNWFGWEKNNEDKKPEKFHDVYGSVEDLRKEIESVKKAYFEKYALKQASKKAMVKISRSMGSR